ncbi:MAG: hypothetical protein WC628_07650 [Candidatus Omnitrophota bacterium]
MYKKRVKRYIRKRHWEALYRLNKRFFSECLGDNFPAFIFTIAR